VNNGGVRTSCRRKRAGEADGAPRARVVGSANLKTEPTEQRGRLEVDHALPVKTNGLLGAKIAASL
jgi:hypothetical protein